MESSNKGLKKYDKKVKNPEKICFGEEIEGCSKIDDYIAGSPVIGPKGKIISHGKAEYGLPSFLKSPIP